MGIAIGLVIGAALGIVLGIIIKNIAVWLSVGIGCGISIGAGIGIILDTPLLDSAKKIRPSRKELADFQRTGTPMPGVHQILHAYRTTHHFSNLVCSVKSFVFLKGTVGGSTGENRVRSVLGMSVNFFKSRYIPSPLGKGKSITTHTHGTQK